jgi:hypothetical protein
MVFGTIKNFRNEANSPAEVSSKPLRFISLFQLRAAIIAELISKILLTFSLV